MTDIALVTGGGGTLGTNVAQRLMTKDFRVVLAGRSQDKLDNSPLKDVLKFAADLSNPENIGQLYLAIFEQYGEPPSLLAHCAGSVMVRPMNRITQEQYHNCVRNNLDTAFFTLQKFVQGLLDHKLPGSAVLVSSVAGRIGISNHTDIAAPKPRIKGMNTIPAPQKAKQPKRINAIPPP